ncbi:zinc ribbon domain-containing protein [Alkalihalobacillus pseudalcaliphilus]|uniref:zinc ribbon domain-containing protein n=1 Tax=Alkalihalobacillus pseudalcaliphilus TaxID=79884 RepID=UPI00064DD12D|nr:zinc ribbon domain-containing protein [Alkalihalobacillus pseudalcaliphilus]KMK78254.1 hypothetical protein AB990_02125 [Alkalihalobacillus pseudalcaliphilus]
MNCPSCGKTLSQEDKFCIYCGAKVEQPLNAEEPFTTKEDIIVPSNEGEAGNKIKQEPPVNPGQTSTEEAAATADATGVGEAVSSNKQPNEKVEQAKKAANDYFSFIFGQAKAPAETALRFEKSHFIFGYINIGVIAFFFALATYFQYTNSTLSRFENISFFEVFFTGLISMALFLVAIAGLLFIVLKSIYKVDVGFHDLISQYGVFLSVPVYLSAAYLISALVDLNFLLFFTVILFIPMIFAGVVAVFFHYKEQLTKGLDSIYGLLIIFVGIGLMLYITSDYLLNGLIRAIF